MTATARDLLNAIDRLPEPDRRAIAVEFLRRASEQDVPPLGDEDLALAAEELFLQLDAQEAADVRPSSG